MVWLLLMLQMLLSNTQEQHNLLLAKSQYFGYKSCQGTQKLLRKYKLYSSVGKAAKLFIWNSHFDLWTKQQQTWEHKDLTDHWLAAQNF